jgi:hypothetical protein
MSDNHKRQALRAIKAALRRGDSEEKIKGQLRRVFTPLYTDELFKLASWPSSEELNHAREEAERAGGDNTPPPPSKEARA